LKKLDIQERFLFSVIQNIRFFTAYTKVNNALHSSVVYPDRALFALADPDSEKFSDPELDFFSLVKFVQAPDPELFQGPDPDK
jgi:hypothetical protein